MMELNVKEINGLEILMNEKILMSKQIKVTIEIITPDLARSFLMVNLKNKNVKNRKIHNRTVDAYVDDILNDRWMIGAPFFFDYNEAMIDGQTRSTAIVKANKPIISLVVRGLDPDSFYSFDSGKKRSHKNVLETLISSKSKVLMKPASVSAGINLMLSILSNYKTIEKTRKQLTNSEIFNMVKKNFNYFNDPFQTGKIQKWRKNVNLSIVESIFTSFYYINKKTHIKTIDEFFDIITSNNSTTPPIVREFRDMMIENKGRKSDERGYLTPKQVYLLIDSLFNYHNSKQGLLQRKHFSKNDLERTV